MPAGDADPNCLFRVPALPSQWDIWYSTLSLQMVAQSWPHQQPPLPQLQENLRGGGDVFEDAIPTGFKEQVQFLPLS